MTYGFEGINRGVKIVGGVVFAPQVLIEGLNGDGRVREALPQAKAPCDFAVGEMDEDFTDGPFARRPGLMRAIGGDAFEIVGELDGRFAEYGERVVSAEEGGVGVHFWVVGFQLLVVSC